ncbi:NAD(P)-dependent oxidoreductase [Microbacterium sp. RG1]|uniref:NAD(P)-dependent oxidoreductase n=1 Tax=Microbacterium sp. RG1 TaxID=2489212 RepID=UPI0010CA2781|nr:NAD(P)H-binding protein [Microbacterium sp. RG1]QCQ15693.1 NAD-dependent epimerase/dehydratase family protein [Microbacterium sp. RG1]
MTTITVFGGTGYAGGHIVAEAARRGHRVIVASRSAQPPAEGALENVEYRAIDVRNDAQVAAAMAEADVVVSALSPRGALDGVLGEVDRTIADLARDKGARLFVVGGFSSLRRSPDSPRVIDEGFGRAEGVPEEMMAALVSEATQMNDILLALLDRDDDLDWVFLSPGMEFGAHVPGDATGRYRVGTDGLVLADENGRTVIGGADFATAVLDEIESDAPRRGHLAIAY